MDTNELLIQEQEPLSDSDIRRILGKDCKILEYKDLLNYKNINEILTKDNDYFILLYELQAQSGHWVGVLKYDNLIEFHDPYGLNADKELAWISKSARAKLHEQCPYLSKLINNSDMKFIHNTTRFQSFKSSISTCGDHVVHRIYRFIHDKLDLDDYIQYMSHLKKEYHLNYDEIVSEFILSFNH